MPASGALVWAAVPAAVEPAALNNNGEATAAELTSMNFRLVISDLVFVMILTPLVEHENGIVPLGLYRGVPVNNDHAKSHD